jgi:glycerol-3-phosphate dehydrogenase (NAD(P)+)
MDLDGLHRRARLRRANPVVYGVVRVVFQTFFHVYFRMQRIGREHIPRTGPVIVAANHRSFLDPFVIACMARRPMYYVAKKEIFFYHRVVAWLLAALGAFPIDRGAGDAESIATARAILARGDIVLIFPEGTRTRPGVLGRPKRGVGRLALETGAPVVPVAVIGTEAVRRGWRIRPHRVRIRAGRALRFPQVDAPSVALAGAVTERIWPRVALQWEWLGDLPPVRRATVIGSGARADSIADWLSRAGVEVDLAGSRTLGDADLERAEMICLAVPARELPAILPAHGRRITRRTGVLVACDGMVPPLGTLPSAFAAERCAPWAVAVLAGVWAGRDGSEIPVDGGSVVVASLDRGFARQVAEPLRSAGLDVAITADVTGVELAGCATGAAALAAGLAAPRAGASAAGAAAGKVFAEVDALAAAQGSRPGTFAGVAGAGALVAAVVGDDRVDAADVVPLLLAAAGQARVRAPGLDSLTAVVEGRMYPDQVWPSEAGRSGSPRLPAA